MSGAILGTALRVAVAVPVFLLGLYGFSQTHGSGQGGGFLGDIGNTFELIGGRLPTSLDGKSLPLSLTLARIGLPLVTSWATLSLVWLRVRNPVRAALIRWRGDHLVVAGDEEIASHAVLGERRLGKPALIWTNDASAPWIGAAADAGAPHVVGDFGTATVPKGLGLAKARTVLLAGPDGAANAAAASAVVRSAADVRASGEPLMVIARVDDPDLRASLEGRLAFTGDRKRAQLRFVSVPDIAARRLFLQHAADRFQRGRGERPRLVFLGFGPLSEAYALRLLAGAHHSGGVKRTLLILAPDAADRERVFRARHPGASAITDVIFRPAQVDEPALVSEALAPVLADGGGPDGLVIDLSSTERNLSVALAVDAAFARVRAVTPPIYVAGVDHLPEGVSALLRPVGGPAGMADPELLLQDKLDALARSIHDFYLESRLSEGAQMGSRISMQEWDDLPEEVRDDNRLIADCYTLKLRDIGARLEPGQGEGFHLEPDEVEALARAEHDRWMAAKLLTGWVHGETRDDAAKRHPDIVPYDALSEPIKEIDREQIRVMTRVLAAADRRPVRDHVLKVESSEAGAGAGGGAGWDAVAASLARTHPDVKPVLLAAFDDPDARRLATAAMTAGGGVQLILSRAADETLAGLGGRDREEAMRLLAGADRVFALCGEAWDDATREAFARERAHARLRIGAREPEPLAASSKSEPPAAWAS